jgi:hypothetical protein
MGRYLLLAVTIFQINVCGSQNYRYIDSVMRVCPVKYTYAATDIAAYINRHFAAKNDKLRAAYSWVAQNISYDVTKMYSGITYKQESEVVEKVLKTRRTICFGYAVTFKTIAEMAGVKVVMISGYTKQNNKIDDISHVWCATKLNGEWRLIDPSWSAGYVEGRRFYKKFNDKWFLVKPADCAKSRIPFDPVWQFSWFPVNNREFYAGSGADSVTSRFFSYPDTIKAIEQMSVTERLAAENRRIRSMGVNNRLIEKRIADNEKYAEHLRQEADIDRYNSAVTLFNQASALYNLWAKNPKRFDGNLQDAAEMLHKSSGVLDSIRDADEELATAIKDLRKSIHDLGLSIKKRIL